MESIYWVVSKDCNQRCAHCYNNSGPGEAGLTPREVSRVVAQLPDGIDVPVDRVIIGGGEPLVWQDLLRQALDKLGAHFQGRARLEIQTNGDLLEARVIEELAARGLNKISVSGIDAYHLPATRQRRDMLEGLLRDCGFVEEQEADAEDRRIFDIWGVTSDRGVWPRGRARSRGISKATLEDRFCPRWSGGKGFLNYREPGSEVNIQLHYVYPCCPMPIAPIGDILQEPLFAMLDRCARHPAFQAINQGRPEALGVWMGISEEQAFHRAGELGNLCLWCDEFFSLYAPEALWAGP
jgi:hypothetical protein